MIPTRTERHAKIFSTLHPLIQNNTLEIVISNKLQIIITCYALFVVNNTIQKQESIIIMTLIYVNNSSFGG